MGVSIFRMLECVLACWGLADLECLSVDNTSSGVQMVDSRSPSMYLLAVFPLCPFSGVSGYKF